MQDEDQRTGDPAKGFAIGLLLAVFLFWLPLIVIVTHWSDINVRQFALDLWRDVR